MFDPRNSYRWEMETSEGEVLPQYNDKGEEQTWKKLPLDKIVRVTFIPTIPGLPVHSCLIDVERGERFVKRFATGFIKQSSEGFKLQMYVNCVMTNRYRYWVFSDGKTLVTRNDYEVNL